MSQAAECYAGRRLNRARRNGQKLAVQRSSRPFLYHKAGYLPLCIVFSIYSLASAAGCAGGDPDVTACPSALAAAQALTGNNVQLPVSNAAFSGNCNSALFQEQLLLITDFRCHYLASKMPLGALVLSNGDARIGAMTSNTDSGKSLAYDIDSTDQDMIAASAAAGYNQSMKDAALLTFDITPTVSGPLAFQYVFGSEEYPSYAPSPGFPTPYPFNDIFGFFIWSSGSHTNVALLPNSTDPVTISTVNKLYDTYYVANDYIGATSTLASELNGMTSLIKTADYYVTAGTTYRIKLGIADGFDAGVDSVVWIRAGSVRFNIKDCVGAWVPHTWGPLQGKCTGACAGGAGLLPEVYLISVASANGGNDCPTVNGTTRLSTPCNNTDPCPVNCTGSWVETGNCTGQCSGGSGLLPEVFNVTSPAMYGGSCPHVNGTTRLSTACNNTTPCPPRDCVGSWVARNCSGDCGGGEGLLLEEFVVTVAAAYNGSECPGVNGTLQSVQACNNTNPCPINCTGSWEVLNSSMCTGHCSGGDGFVPETFVISQAAMYGGVPCSYSNNTVRFEINCTNLEPCPPVDCVGVWVTAGLCNGSCGGGAGLRPESFNITRQAAYGGANCSAEQGEMRIVTPCTNSTPCPIDCIGNWSISGNCSGACEGGNGTLPETYTVTTAARWGGIPCPFADGATRSIINCTNDAPCPVPCNFTWIPNGNCTGACGGGGGTIPELFIIIDPALYGGTCPASNGTTRSTLPCTNNDPCPPVDCVGAFRTGSNTCNGTCGGGAGKLKQVYTISTAAAWGGQNCSEAAGTVRYIDCNNTACCPVNCVASWVTTGSCNGACSGGFGKLPEKYVITVPSVCGGVSCAAANNTPRLSTNCINSTPCPPRNCTGSWVARNCSGACGGGVGLLLEEYVVTVTAAYNGTECPVVHGTSRSQQACNNTNPCPINCTGTWQVLNPNNCTGACDGGPGFIPETYIISQAALYGGVPCGFNNRTMRNVIACNNTTPCPPVNCVGYWTPDVVPEVCVGGCGPHAFGVRNTGWKAERYVVSTPAARNGTQCPAQNGEKRFVSRCDNNSPCDAVLCNGTWTATGPCSGSCNNGSGTMPEVFAVSGDPRRCTPPNGATRISACINTTPCPINCVGSWGNWTNCTADCNGGNQTSKFTVTTAAQHGGVACEAANNTVRNRTCNMQPCPPINCTGNWSEWTNCTADCNGGNQTSVFTLYAPAQYGGVECEATNNTVRNRTCNMQPCPPVNCTGNWTEWTNCTADCAGGNQTSLFTVYAPAQYGGVECEATNNTVRNRTCNTQPCPPVNCTGNWSEWTNCTAECAGGSQTSLFTVYVPAQYGGVEGEAANSTVRNRTCNTHPCPIDCLGHWGNWSACNKACGTGYQFAMFQMERASMYGGVNCEAANKTVRNQTCNEQPCPVPCVGQFVNNGRCLATCSSSGLQYEVFQVTTPELHDGAPCAFSNGTTRFVACVNSTVCPWASVVVPDSPPVLPPINTTLNNTGVVIKGGNVTISGIKIEGVSGSTNGFSGSVTSSGFSIGGGSSNVTGGSDTTTTSKPVKPRIAAFNGTLGFYTLGLLVEVLGEFELQRSMAWSWDGTLSAWTTQVAIRGTFVLTREESVNNVTVSIQTLKPRVSGYLNLWSKSYPGPGFSGRYDWSGELELAPDPFTEWQDAQSLLASNINGSTPVPARHRSLMPATTPSSTVPSRSSSASSGSDGSSKINPLAVLQRLLLPDMSSQASSSSATTSSSSRSSSAALADLDQALLPASQHRSLLQDGGSGNTTSTGMVPVQGRVGIRESKAPADPSGTSTPGTVSLDDTGDITLICQGGQCPVPPSTILGGVGEAGGQQGQSGDKAQGPAGSALNLSLLNIILVAVCVPAGLALCAAGVAAGVLRRRNKQKEKEAESAKKDEGGKQGGKESWRSTDGVSRSPIARPAMLRRSTAGSCSGSPEDFSTDGQGTSVERVQPGETGFGSMPGGLFRFGSTQLMRGGSIEWPANMPTLPPARDSMDLAAARARGSIDWSVVQEDRSNRGAKWSIAGSIAGVATSMAHVLNFRPSQTGDAYRVPEPGTGGGIFKQGSGGFFSNPLFHPFGNIAQSIHGNNPAPAQSSRAPGRAAAGQQPGTSARSPVPPGGIAGAPGRLVMQQQAKNAAELSLSTVLGGQGTAGEGRSGRPRAGEPRHNYT